MAGGILQMFLWGPRVCRCTSRHCSRARGLGILATMHHEVPKALPFLAFSSATSKRFRAIAHCKALLPMAYAWRMKRRMEGNIAYARKIGWRRCGPGPLQRVLLESVGPKLVFADQAAAPCPVIHGPLQSTAHRRFIRGGSTRQRLAQTYHTPEKGYLQPCMLVALS